MDETQADVALLGRAAERDGGALAALYDRHSRALYSLILRILDDRAAAEEVLQDVFVRVWTNAERYERGLGSPAAWLIRIARGRAIDRLRTTAATPTSARSSPVAGGSERPAPAGDHQRTAGLALQALPDDQRQLIEQAYFAGLTETELAERFGLPTDAIRSRLRSAMLAFRRGLQQVAGAGHGSS